MASVALLFFGLMFSVPTGNSLERLLKLKCESAVGVIGQNTNIPCSIESRYKPAIYTVILKRIEEENPCFEYQPHENTVTGDTRFKVLGDSSLQLQNTAISDEGEYEYYIRTNMGWYIITFTISVTGRSSFNEERKGTHHEDVPGTNMIMIGTWKILIVVVVIVCLIIILLVVFWFTQKCLHSLRKAKSMDLPRNFSRPADVEKFALNEPVNKKQLMPEENVAVSRLIL